MNKIYIQTLSPIHIGSGKELIANTEYLHFTEEYSMLVVIDENKILDIIGEENIDKWISIIQKNEDLKDYLSLRKKDLKSDDIKKRIIYLQSTNISNNKTLKEQLHNGEGLPYIPGSSIKGAIRTAIVAKLASENKDLSKSNLKNRKGNFDGQQIEKKLFGFNPNEDVFRFLQVGDAYFDYETNAVKSEVINLEGNKWRFKKGSSSIVECIPQGIDDIYFKMKINKKLIDLNNKKNQSKFLDEKELFKIINNHTKRLIDKEIEFWKEQDNIDFNVFEDYLQNLKDLKETADNCKDNEAVLRIGFGSGWNFITGAWSTDEEIMNDFDYERFLSQVRKKKYGDNVPFPKTRMIADNGDLFGFVKLKMED